MLAAWRLLSRLRPVAENRACRERDTAPRLTRTERLGWWLGDLFARRLALAAWAWSYAPMGVVLWLAFGRRVRLHGGATLASLPR